MKPRRRQSLLCSQLCPSLCPLSCPLLCPPSHSVRSSYAEQRQSVLQDNLSGSRQNKTSPRDRLRFIEDVRLVIPQVRLARQVVQIRRDAMRLERIRCAGNERGEVEQVLDDLLPPRPAQHRKGHPI